MDGQFVAWTHRSDNLGERAFRVRLNHQVGVIASSLLHFELLHILLRLVCLLHMGVEFTPDHCTNVFADFAVKVVSTLLAHLDHSDIRLFINAKSE